MISKFQSILAGIYIGALSAVASLGCGGYDDQATDPTDEEAELGELEQEISTGTGGYGFSTATSQLRCGFPGPLGQACWAALAANKAAVGYCFSGFSATDRADLANAVEQVDAQVNWSFIPVGFPCDISIQNGGVPGSSSANVENFVRFTPTGTVGPLTSPAGATHVNGSWQSFTKGSIVIDVAKVVAAQGGGVVLSRNLTHFGGHVTAKYMGLGTQQLAGGTFQATRRAVSAGLINGGLSAGEVCRANNTTTGTFNQISMVAGCAVD